MTLLFSGNDFKYEIEAVVKLFFPVRSFNIEYNVIKVEGNYVFIRRRKGKVHTYLFSSVMIDGKKVRLSTKVKNDISGYETECEQNLCRLLFQCLTKITGKKISWGMLTGVRPVKLINKAILTYNNDEEKIIEHFNLNYFTHEDKIKLAYKTANVQSKILKNIPKNSFSLYISIPFCPTRCSYCSFVAQEIGRFTQLIPEYVERICDEIKLTSEIAKNIGLSLDTVYFGGGTPTSLSANQLSKIMRSISDNFDLGKLREYTVEAGRADTITIDKLNVIKENGADRISINPQTLSNSVLKNIGRNHTAEDFYRTFTMAKEIGFKVINTDLIAGLPTDTEESFVNTINEIIKLSPENVTVHTLSIKRSANINSTGQGIEAIRNSAKSMVEYSISQLIKNDYSPYYLYRQKNMVDNLENIGYSKKGCESLYNIYIMEEAQTILAVGAGASTKLISANSQKIERIFNYKLPLEYIKNYDKVASKKQEILDFYK